MKTLLEAEIRRDGESISDVNVPIMKEDLKPSLELKEWSCVTTVSLWLHTPECALRQKMGCGGFSVC